VLALVAVAAYWYRFLTFTQFSNDHFVHLAVARQIVGGDWPVRDFVDRGAPLMSVVSAAAQQVLGEGQWSELVLVSLALAVAAAVCVFITARLSGSLAAGVALGLATVLIYPYSYSYPKLLVYAIALAVAWLYFSQPSWLRLTALAASLAAAFLFRHDHGLLLAVGVAAACVASQGLGTPGLLRLAAVASVALACVAPYLAWIHRHEGLDTYVRDGITFSRREAERSSWGPPGFALDPGKPLWSRLQLGPIVNVRWDAAVGDEDIRRAERRHGLTRYNYKEERTWQYALSRWSPAALEQLVTDPAVADTHGIDRLTFALQVPAPGGLRVYLTRLYGPGEGMRLRENSVSALFYAVWLLPIVALVVLWKAWGHTSPEVRAVVVMTAVVQLAMNATMLREPLGNRIRDVIVPAVTLVAFLAGALWRRPGSWLVRVPVRVGAVALVAAIIVITGSIGEAVPRWSDLTADGLGGMAKRAGAVNFRLSPPQDRTGCELSQPYRDLVGYIRRCTPERSRVLGLSFVPELYVYTGRAFAGGHVMFIPGYYVDDRHTSLMLARLSREDVPLVILDNQTRDEIASTYRRLWAHVSSRYREAGQFEIRPGRTLIVLAETARRTTGTDGDAAGRKTALPCFAGAS
jgi:hypothetical protein